MIVFKIILHSDYKANLFSIRIKIGWRGQSSIGEGCSHGEGWGGGLPLENVPVTGQKVV